MLNVDGWIQTTTVSSKMSPASIYFSHMGPHEKWCITSELLPTTCKHEPECSFSKWNWPLSSCCPGQRQISHSHNDTTTIPGQSSVLHLKAYLTFHSSIHSLWAVRLWAWPRLAFGRQCSELKATHGPSLVLSVTKHTSRARNSWPVFLTHKEKLGIGDKYRPMALGSEPGQTSVVRWNKTDGLFPC